MLLRFWDAFLRQLTETCTSGYAALWKCESFGLLGFSGLLSGFYGTYRVLMGVKESYGF